MKRIDKMMRDAQIIQKERKPVFFFALIEILKAGYRMVCHLAHGEGKEYEKRFSFHPDLQSAYERVEKMKQEYPSPEGEAPSIIIDDIPEGEYNGEGEEIKTETHDSNRGQTGIDKGI